MPERAFIGHSVDWSDRSPRSEAAAQTVDRFGELLDTLNAEKAREAFYAETPWLVADRRRAMPGLSGRL
jgi:hypothetical protein